MRGQLLNSEKMLMLSVELSVTPLPIKYPCIKVMDLLVRCFTACTTACSITEYSGMQLPSSLSMFASGKKKCEGCLRKKNCAGCMRKMKCAGCMRKKKCAGCVRDAWAADMDLQVDGWGGPLIIAIQNGFSKQWHILASIAATCATTRTLLPGT